MDFEVKDWWDKATLWLRSDEPDDAPTIIEIGTLAELLILTRSRDRVELDRLYITSTSSDAEIGAKHMRALLQRPDFPVFI